MIYKNVELHNVDAIRKTDDGLGVELRRFPDDVCDALKGESSLISRTSTGCEVRFITNASKVWVRLSCKIEDVVLQIFCGDFIYKTVVLKKDVIQTVQIDIADIFENVDVEKTGKALGRFSKDVWRIHISSLSSYVTFYGIEGLDGLVRPPVKNNEPFLKWLAYGSSITQGALGVNSSCSYIQHAARLLSVDVLNKGMSGSCYCDKEIAFYFCENEWDFATFEIGVDMYRVFKTKDFKKRAQYFIETVHEAKPDKKIFIITPYSSWLNCGTDKDILDKHEDYVKILKEIVENIHSSNLILINGEEILDRFEYLSADLVHPSEYGHARMGENLYNILKNKI